MLRTLTANFTLSHLISGTSCEPTTHPHILKIFTLCTGSVYAGPACIMEEEVSVSTYANRDSTLPILQTRHNGSSSTATEDNTANDLSSDDEETGHGNSGHMPAANIASDSRRGLRGTLQRRTRRIQDRLMDK